MVEFVFNLQGYFYQSGIKVLRQSYDTAEQALYTALENAQSDLSEYEKAQAAGAPFEGARDDDGYLIWSQDQVLEGTVDAAQEALDSLRRSFAISLYHTWERGARIWTGAPHDANHQRLVKGVEALGMAVDPDLDVLRLVANVLKHDNNRRGNELLAAAPDLLAGVQSSPPNRIDWYEKVIISMGWMGRFFDAVAASGPTTKTVFPKTP